MGEDLSTRVESEKAAYNDGGVHARSSRLQQRFLHVFTCPNAKRVDAHFTAALAASVPGNDIIEYGCYTGAVIPGLASLQPRRIIGIDISNAAIAQARAAHGRLAKFAVMDAHNLALPEGSVDVVIGRAILHHLHFNTAMFEVRRVLRPGGRAIFIEPLRDNPAAKFLRALTPGARTRYELPLSRRQIQAADRIFAEHRHFFGGLVSVTCGLASSLVSSDPNNLAMRAADWADLALARTPLRWWMRMAVLCWTK